LTICPSLQWQALIGNRQSKIVNIMLTTGVDIIYVPRVERAIHEFGDRFLERVYTPMERLYCRERVPELAVRFAAKEAVGKALGVGMRILARDGILWHEAEVIGDLRGKPLVRLYGGAARRAEELGLKEWSISLTHEREYAVAFVVAM
jgi:holo-[acyl-carrier protein] synthase